MALCKCSKLSLLSGEEDVKIALKILIPIIRKNGHPPPNASRRGPNGYWFLVAAALSNTTRPCDNYVLAVYRCWNYHKGGIQSLGKS